MKSTFTTRIFRSILPWMAVLFLLASWLFFYYQAKVFVEEKTEDMEVLIADRAHDFDERFNVIGYVQGNLNYEKVTGMLKSTLKGRREAESVFGAITRDGEIVFAEDADSTNAKAAEVILQNASSESGRFEIRKPERQTVIYQSAGSYISCTSHVHPAHDAGNQAACAADTAPDGAPEEPGGARRY